MVSQLRSNQQFVASAKEKLPELESTALELMDEIPSLKSQVESARQSVESVTTRRRELARALIKAKTNTGQESGSDNTVARLEADLKEVSIEERGLTKEIEETSLAIAKANARLRKTASEIYKIHAVLGTTPSTKLTRPRESSNNETSTQTDTPKPTPKASDTTGTAEPKRRDTSDVNLLRKWKSADGQYEVSAWLVSQNDASAVLRKVDGREITVPISALSRKDVEYLRTRK
jgi:predicted RNase H-like nuclease (RuvC/YqgF family)